MVGVLNQSVLHNCGLKLPDHVGVGSVFPLFNDSGKTKALMLTWQNDAQLSVIEYSLKLFRGRSLLSKFRGHKLNLRRSDLPSAEDDAATFLADLWHFDPWWVLKDERYVGHPLSPPLQATNLPGFDESIQAVWFTPTLSRLKLVGFEGGKDENGNPQLRIKRFKPAHLEPASKKRTARGGPPAPAIGIPRSTSGSPWRLRPFWES